MRVDEVHADLNPSPMHESNSSVQACLGYICGMGFDGKIKPDSWAASSVAHRKTQGNKKKKKVKKVVKKKK